MSPRAPPPSPRVFSLSLRSLYVNLVGLWLTVSLAVFSGLTMFSIYKDCDPLANGDIGTHDQVGLLAVIIASTQASVGLHVS